MALLLRQPKASSVSCNKCQETLHDDNWEPITRGGLEMARPESIPPNCNGCVKIPDSIKSKQGYKVGPKDAVVLSTKNHMAYMYYLEVKAGAKMHEDTLTRKLCACIRMVEDRYESEKSDKLDLIPMVLAMFRMNA